ncbi:MAG: orotate phosphoribosyltransferase [Candidatus Verstraetearchaeota archaeon]|nr:orotate phosphoribosyltransferase [Candidatus Verstraetearchaeota archaeon]
MSEFAEFLVRSGAVKFGSFTLKSGRSSPYFVNLGVLADGESVSRLGAFYAASLVEKNLVDVTDVLFGPSYKGIPIAVATAISLHRDHSRSVRFAFNRKEAKGHGEGGMIVGSPLRDGDRVGLLDDVITTGKTKEEAISLIRSSARVDIQYILIAVDRMERGETELCATREFEERTGIPVHSIATIEEVAEVAAKRGLLPASVLDLIRSYLAQHGGRRK